MSFLCRVAKPKVRDGWAVQTSRGSSERNRCSFTLKSDKRWFRHVIRTPSRPPSIGGDPGVDPELPGGTTLPIWPNNRLRIPQGELERPSTSITWAWISWWMLQKKKKERIGHFAEQSPDFWVSVCWMTPSCSMRPELAGPRRAPEHMPEHKPAKYPGSANYALARHFLWKRTIVSRLCALRQSSCQTGEQFITSAATKGDVLIWWRSCRPQNWEILLPVLFLWCLANSACPHVYGNRVTFLQPSHPEPSVYSRLHSV